MSKRICELAGLTESPEDESLKRYVRTCRQNVKDMQIAFTKKNMGSVDKQVDQSIEMMFRLLDKIERSI